MQTKIKRTKFVQKESHKHRLAKELLAKWFRDQEEKSDSCGIGNVGYRKNWGVYLELPFYEKSEQCYFECSDYVDPWLRDNSKLCYVDNDYEKLFKQNIDRGKLLFVPDITIFHKGDARIFIEVVHSNPVSQKKIDIIKKWLNGGYAEVFEIDAEEILRHCDVPNTLNFKRIL